MLRGMPELGQLPLLDRASALVGRNKHLSTCEFPVGIQAIPNPFGAPPSGIEVISMSVSQTVAPPTPSQDRASQNMETMVQGLVKSSLTQLGVFPQEAP